MLGNDPLDRVLIIDLTKRRATVAHRPDLFAAAIGGVGVACDSHASSDPHTWARRLKLLRSFTHWLVQFEPSTEVPGDAIFGRLPERQAPHIYSEQEIIDLGLRLAPAIA